MSKEIAVFVNHLGEAASFAEPGELLIYGRREGRWAIKRSLAFSLDQSSGLAATRRQIGECLQFLRTCNIFVGLSVVGVPFFEMEKQAVKVWECEGKPSDFLDYVLRREEEKETSQLTNLAQCITSPIAKGEGKYFISLKDIQSANTGVTSKQALLPFLRQGHFYELEVNCRHIPPWLESEIAAGNLVADIELIQPHEYKVLITKSCCNAGAVYA